MNTTFWTGLWAELIDHPLFFVALVLVAFQLSLLLYRRTRWLLLQPVMVSTALVAGVLLFSGVEYSRFREGASLVLSLIHI